jgi:signal recognition particle subunit SRP54
LNTFESLAESVEPVMLEIISRGFQSVRARLEVVAPTKQTINDAVRDIRRSLLEADVDQEVAKALLARLEERAHIEIVQKKVDVALLGTSTTITPYHRFVAICQEELEATMGGDPVEIGFATGGITVIMMLGLQGAGKTSSCAKLAKWLTERHEKKVMLAAADLQRPAAIDQLERLGGEANVPVFVDRTSRDPVQVCGDALRRASQKNRDVLILDTAGRLAIDQALMEELSRIRDRTRPQETLLVLDAMTGQDAVRSAKLFDASLGVSGFVMTKLDGDARGGAALSVRAVTGKPIKMITTGESIRDMEIFRPEGLASRILGMGDVVGLVEEFERHVDRDKAETDAERMFRGQFDMTDFVEQIEMLRKMGSLNDLMAKMPMLQNDMRPDERELMKIVAVHDSMTPKERRRPALLSDKRRKLRVARGCGRDEAQVGQVLEKYDTMRRMMITLGERPSMLASLPGFQNLAKVRKLRGLDLSDLFGEEFAEAFEEEETSVEEPTSNKAVSTAKTSNPYFADISAPGNNPRKGKQDKVRRKLKSAKKARRRNRK